MEFLLQQLLAACLVACAVWSLPVEAAEGNNLCAYHRYTHPPVFLFNPKWRPFILCCFCMLPKVVHGPRGRREAIG